MSLIVYDSIGVGGTIFYHFFGYFMMRFYDLVYCFIDIYAFNVVRNIIQYQQLLSYFIFVILCLLYLAVN